MADDARRGLERHAATGDPQARARLLVERVRTGALAKERLLLAAHLGDAAARAATAATGSPLSASACVSYALSHCDGSPTYLRWALDCAERALRGVDEALAARARGALSVARRELSEPVDDAERRRAVRLSHELILETGRFDGAPPARLAVYHAVGTMVDKNEIGNAVDAAARAAGDEDAEREWQARRLAALLLE